ncbi:MAG: PhnD/SsuA/transferrin family substrate-binding protein [SAR324 cluster bacterium]|nr:PhnD/SsuA/transferrin family substrate-binding protein [SAR324 cluster bacterium]
MKLCNYLRMIIIISFLSLAICSSAKLSQAVPEAPTSELMVGYHHPSWSDVDPKDILVAFSVWAQKLASGVGLTVKTEIYTNIHKIVHDFQQQKIDIMAIYALDYLCIKPYIDAELAYSSVQQNKVSRKYLLLASAEKPFDSIQDGKGKKLANVSEDQTAQLFLNTLLFQNKLPEAKQFFSEIQNKKKLSQTVLSLFFGQADLAVTTDTTFLTMAELNPQLRKKLKIIAMSPPVLTRISLFRKGLDESLKKFLIHEAQIMHTTAQGRQFLLLMQGDEVRIISQADIAPLETMLHEYHRQNPENNLCPVIKD